MVTGLAGLPFADFAMVLVGKIEAHSAEVLLDQSEHLGKKGTYSENY